MIESDTPLQETPLSLERSLLALQDLSDDCHAINGGPSIRIDDSLMAVLDTLEVALEETDGVVTDETMLGETDYDRQVRDLEEEIIDLEIREKLVLDGIRNKQRAAGDDDALAAYQEALLDARQRLSSLRSIDLFVFREAQGDYELLVALREREAAIDMIVEQGGMHYADPHIRSVYDEACQKVVELKERKGISEDSAWREPALPERLTDKEIKVILRDGIKGFTPDTQIQQAIVEAEQRY